MIDRTEPPRDEPLVMEGREVVENDRSKGLTHRQHPLASPPWCRHRSGEPLANGDRDRQLQSRERSIPPLC
ncbi:hypothetical protein [Microvirga tunisiensis]|uniref:hypothetical protein n=1 Tax=Microvirga tunisiensis TaxID=2108360 RepID=UPI00129CDBDC|nr:hypothetical protein [Microvirga tunisiensis]